MKKKVINIFIFSLSLINIPKAYGDEGYNAKTMQLGAIVYGVLENGSKGCKAVASALPPSIDKWWKGVSVYKESEIKRDQTYKDNVTAINQKISLYKDNNAPEAQVELIGLELEAQDNAINSINGSGGRLPIRTKLLEAINSAIESNTAENKLVNDATTKLNDTSIPKAISVAKDACERKKNGKKDPVKNCDVAQSKYNELLNYPLKDIKTLLKINESPSIELNNKLIGSLILLKEKFKAIPKSDDSKYDWTMNIESEVNDLEKSIKNTGVKCDSNVGITDYDRSLLNTILPKLNTTSSSTTKTPNPSDETKKLLEAMGIDTTTSGLFESYEKSFNATDLVIGQAAHRFEYLNFSKETIAAIIKYDEGYLKSLQENRAKLYNKLQEVKKSLSSGVKTSNATNLDTKLLESTIDQKLLTSTLVASKAIEIINSDVKSNVSSKFGESFSKGIVKAVGGEKKTEKKDSETIKREPATLIIVSEKAANKTDINLITEDEKVTFNSVKENVQKKNKNDFVPNENDSIFEVVTKAYYRNYEKINLEK